MDPNEVANRPFVPYPGYEPPPPRPSGLWDQWWDQFFKQWREYWGRVPPSVKFLYGCQSLALPPLGIPGLLNEVGDYYEDPNFGNGTDALLSGCGVFCLGLTGQLASTPGILNDLMDSIKEQYGDNKNAAY